MDVQTPLFRNPTVEDYYSSSDSENDYPPRRNVSVQPNVATKRFKEANLEQNKISGYRPSHGTDPTGSSEVSKCSRDSGFHSDPDAGQRKIAPRPRGPTPPISTRSPTVARQPYISDDEGNIRIQVNALEPLSLHFKGDMDGRTLQIIPAEGGKADIVMSAAHRRHDEKTYDSNPRTYLGRRSSFSRRTSRERIPKSATDYGDPSYVTYGSTRLPRHLQQKTMTMRDSESVLPGRNMRHEKPCVEDMRYKQTYNQSLSNFAPYGMWPNQHFAVPQGNPFSHRDYGYSIFPSAYLGNTPPYVAGHLHSGGPVPSFQPSCAFCTGNPAAPHMPHTPLYEQPARLNSQRPEIKQVRRPVKTAHKRSQKPSAYYSPLNALSDHSGDSDTTDDEEERDYTLAGTVRETDRRTSNNEKECRHAQVPRASSGSLNSSIAYEKGLTPCKHEDITLRELKENSRHHQNSRQPSRTQAEKGERGRVDMKTQMTQERDHKENTSYRNSNTESGDLNEKLHDSIEKLKGLLLERLEKNVLEEELKRERQRAETEERENFEQTETGRKNREKTETPTKSTIADDGDLDFQRTGTVVHEHDVIVQQQRSNILTPGAPPLDCSEPTTPSNAASGLVYEGGGIEKSDPTKNALAPCQAMKIAQSSQCEHTEQIKVPTPLEDTSAQSSRPSSNEHDTRHSQNTVGTRTSLTTLQKLSQKDALEVPNRFHCRSASDGSFLQCESSKGSSTCDVEEEENSFGEGGEDSDGVSEEGVIGVKSALNTAMNVIKGLLLQELLGYALPEANDALEDSGSSSSGSHPGSVGRSASSSFPSCTSGSQIPRRIKRTRDDGRDPGDGDGDDSEDDDRPKKKTDRGLPDRQARRRFKCPFHQRQPEKYTKASCKGEGFMDMAKLKDHIKRVHTQPLRCARCWVTMKSEDAYSKHVQQENICEKKSEPQDDRIQPKMLKQLDFKKAPYASAKSVEDKWGMLFSALFPDDTNIPSPYEQQGMSPRLERALSKALEEELSRELAPLLDPMMCRIRALIPAIIEKCRLELTRTSQSLYEETLSTPSIASSGLGSRYSELGSSVKQGKYQDTSATSRCSGSSCNVVPTTEKLANNEHGTLSQCPMLATNVLNTEGRLEESSARSSSDFSVYHPNAQDKTQKLDKLPRKNLDERFMIFESFSSHEIPTTAESSLSDRINANGFGLCGSVDALLQQNSTYLPRSQSSDWALPDSACDIGSGVYDNLKGAQTGGTMCFGGEDEQPPTWDFISKDFDFSQFSHL